MIDDIKYMSMALDEAREAALADEVPIGAVVVTDSGRVIGRGRNMTQALNDVTAHAEMLAITAASNALGAKYLNDCTLYVTVEPCPMCAGAIGWAQIKRLVYGAYDSKRGYSQICRPNATPLHPRTEVVAGVLADDAAAIMRQFFAKKR